MSSILDYYKYATLATAAYVRMGTEPLTGQHALFGIGPLQRVDMQSLLRKLSAVLSLRRPFLMLETAL